MVGEKINLTDVFVYALNIQKNINILESYQMAYLLKLWFDAKGFTRFSDKYKFNQEIFGFPYDKGLEDDLASTNECGLISFARGKYPHQDTIMITEFGKLYSNRIKNDLIGILGRRDVKTLNKDIKNVREK